MARVKASLTINSTDALSTPVSLSLSTTMDVDSGSVIRAKVATTVVSGAMTVHKADEKLVHSYLYIRNLDPVKENFLYVFADTAADDPVVMKIGGGEFAFVPVQEDQLFKAYGTKTEQLIEYGVFGLDNASNFLA
ncbi:MAG: hypothetical protein CMJ25_25525 [Phycisphaerae bacterium]|nr:hypothetical protein [Phycisphaerae bacterium]|tara:strand:+ start:1506 stop:1910 length:405 start_codon:yes stop_codon:yes gene_type:complete